MQDNIRKLKVCKTYLDKAALYPQFVYDHSLTHIDVVVVIPAFNEPDLKSAIHALLACDMQELSIVILVVINQPTNAIEAIKEVSRNNVKLCNEMALSLDPQIQLYPIFAEFPLKKAGVGQARKTGMDEAVRLLLAAANLDGVILNFDADCSCDSNLFTAVVQKFVAEPDLDAVSICFEHKLGAAGENRRYMEAYELHLRYFIMAQRFTGHPYVHHTIGSSMAVRCTAYCAHGGMNRKKAGEDFYFLNKIIKYGRVKDLNSTSVFPSSRFSDRVPFGTGRAMLIANELGKEPTTYSFETFSVLKDFFLQMEDYFESENQDQDQIYRAIPKEIKSFITSAVWMKNINTILTHAKDSTQRIRRFYQWFDMFMIMKFCHHYRDLGHPKKDVYDEVQKLWSASFNEKLNLEHQNLLQKLREWEKCD